VGFVAKIYVSKNHTQGEGGVNIVQKNVELKPNLMVNGFNVTIVERKFIELLEILRSLKARNSFARKTAIVHGKTKMYVAVKMHQIG